MSTGICNKRTGYHNRQSIRLPGYDYSRPGYYFVTVCIHDRKQNLFGNIVENKMILNEFGSIVQNEILKTEQMRQNVKIDEYVIMPNHCHIILQLRRGTLQRAPDSGLTPLVAHSGTLQRAPDSGLTPLVAHSGTLQRAPTDQTSFHVHTDVRRYVPSQPQIECFGKPTTNSIPTIVRLTKSTITKQINILRHTPGNHVWQRNYYEHIVRDDKSLFYIRKYIAANPNNWMADIENHIGREFREIQMTEIKEI